MRIGLYFDNSNISNVDLRFPENGNPGVGGTPYCFIQLARYLHLNYTNIEVIMYTHVKTLMPEGIQLIMVDNIHEAIEDAAKSEIDIFVFRPSPDKSIYQLLDTLEIRAVTWGHNYYDSKLATLIANCGQIKRNVFVGRQQYDRYIDHEICEKSTFIFNAFSSINSNCLRNNDSYTVTYVGSLVPAKGFHVLAKHWKKIVKAVPNAKLKVIGTGQLYSRNAKLGKYKIADESYEEVFMQYLIDEEGEILESVEFLGLLGQEKVNVFQTTSVGVINPTARTETFGISAVEMQACGIPVVTIKKNGFLDTIKHNITGILYLRENQLAKSVLKLLENQTLNELYGENARVFVNSTFKPEIIVPQWIKLFKQICEGEEAQYISPSGNWTNNLKWLRLLNRNMKKLPLLSKIPAIVDYESIIKSMVKR